MKLTCDTNRLRLFLGNEQVYQKYEQTLREIQLSETDRKKENALWIGWQLVRQENNRRIDCIHERGGILHVGTAFDWEQ